MAKRLSLKIIDGGDLKGFAYLHPEVARQIDADIGSVVTFEEPNSAFWGAAEVRMSNDVPKDSIKIDIFVLDAALLVEGDVVQVELYDQDMMALEYVEFGLVPLSNKANTDDLVIRANKEIASLESILEKRLVYPNMVFNWSQLDVKVKILNTRPSLVGREFARIAFEALKNRSGYQFKTIGIATSFNAILCVDTSGSMKATDVPVHDIAHAREGLKDIAGENPEIKEFLKRFKEDTKVSRAEAAAMAVLLYLAEKVGRGYGEKVGIITFEKDANVMNFMSDYSDKQQPFIECTGRGKFLGLQMISSYVIDKIGEDGTLTNIGMALMKAHEVIEAFGDPKKPVMLILLTDGMHTVGPQPMKVLKEVFGDGRHNLVIYCIGLGERESIDEELMLAIAQYGNGTYHHVDNMTDLLEWYGRLANEFTLVVRGGNSDVHSPPNF